MASPQRDLAKLEVLLTATASGDERAFEQLYALTSPRLFAITTQLLKRRDWAEEALQDVYVRIWQKADSYSPERGAPMAWLCTIARYRALDLLRAKRPEVTEAELNTETAATLVDGVDADAGPEERAVEHTEMQRLDDCLRQLPDEQRNVVVMAYYEGFTHSELSSRLEKPLGTVKSWTRRGLLFLRDCLGAA